MNDQSPYDDWLPHTYGPATCLDCEKHWTAVWPLAADDLECPECGSTNTEREAHGLG